MFLTLHADFEFLELGSVRKKNQVNALVKILVGFAVSTITSLLVTVLLFIYSLIHTYNESSLYLN